MSAPYTSRQVCEFALQKIGAFASIDDAADPDDMVRATQWLDMLIAHTAGTAHCKWLVPANIPLALTADEVSFDLEERAGNNYPANGVIFPLHAMHEYEGLELPLTILRRLDYDMIGDKDLSGPPKCIYIDRTLDMQVYVHPVPAESGHVINLTVQTLAPTLTVTGNAASQVQGATSLRETWNLWSVTALAAQLGDGPVRKLPRDEVRDMRSEAAMLLNDLNAFENREHAGEYRRVRFNR